MCKRSLEIIMLEKLLQHRSLGSQSQITYILDLLAVGNYPVQDLRKACLSKEFAFGGSFDGVMCLLECLDVIRVSNLARLNKEINSNKVTKEICNLLFSKLAAERELHHFLNANNLLFQELLCIKNSLIQLQFSPIRNLLVSLGVFESDPLIFNQFVIGPQFSRWFIETVPPLINQSRLQNMPLGVLMSSLNKKAELGKEAEEYVLRYEQSLRSNHAYKSNIGIISEKDCSAGYDILSYQSDSSVLLDKFIEVKSFSKEVCFYWSANEVEVARTEGDNYFLYLVDRTLIQEPNYSPMVIQNPYRSVYVQDEWKGECQSWKFELSDN